MAVPEGERAGGDTELDALPLSVGPKLDGWVAPGCGAIGFGCIMSWFSECHYRYGVLSEGPATLAWVETCNSTDEQDGSLPMCDRSIRYQAEKVR